MLTVNSVQQGQTIINLKEKIAQPILLPAEASTQVQSELVF